MIQAIKLNKLEQGDDKPHVDTSGLSGEAAVAAMKSDPATSKFLRFK